MKKMRITDRIKYLIERQFVKGAFHQFLMVALVIGIFVFIGGGLIFIIDDESFEKALWWAFLRLTDPGYLGDDIGLWKRIISTLLTISGSVIFIGALVAILTRWFIYEMSNLEQGLTPVTLKNHFVILGLTNRTVPILRDLISSRGRMHRFLKAHDANRLKIVVLGETITAQHNLDLKQDPIIHRMLHAIILRSGTQIQLASIHRTACTTAAAIIIPSSYGQLSGLLSSDTETIKTLFSIQKLAHEQNQKLPYIIVEIDNQRKLPVIKHAYKGPMEVVASDLIISRLLTQTLMYPGMSEVFNELLTAGEGNEFYLKHNTDWTGLALAEISRHYPKGICCGVIRRCEAGLKAMLNLSNEEKVQASDQLIWIARNHRDIELKETSLEVVDKQMFKIPLKSQPRERKTRRLLILGWNDKIPTLIQELSGYKEAVFTLHLMSMVPKGERKEAVERYAESNRIMNCHYIEGDYMIESELQEMNLQHYDSIIIVSSDRLSSSEEGDARAIAGYLMLDALLIDAKRPQIILELNNHENMELLEQNKCETIISPIILSHFLSQIALRRELSLVYDELLSASGAKIELSSYDQIEASLSFQDLSERIKSNGDTLLGIYQHTAINGKRMILNPAKTERIELRKEDYLILLTDEKNTV